MNKGKKISLALAAGTAATVAGAFVGYKIAFQSDPERQAAIEDIPEGEMFDKLKDEMLTNINRLLVVPYERISVRSHDGLTLVGKYYEGQPGAPLIIFFHGYRSTGERDASGGFQLCRERGWNLLVVDQRSHGESGGRTITFGIRERYDCRTWAEYAARRFGPETPIFLWGISMGASTVLMASNLELPASVRGIVADCGFDTPGGIMKSTLRRWRWPQFPMYQFAALGARLFGGFRLNETSALECVRTAHLPILLVHGEEDGIVPCEMAHALRAACASPVTLLTVPGASHGISWYVDLPAYQEALVRFMEENLK